MKEFMRYGSLGSGGYAQSAYEDQALWHERDIPYSPCRTCYLCQMQQLY